MASLSDILILGRIANKISHATVAAMSPGLRYTFRCEVLVNNLNSQLDNLDDMKNSMSKRVDEEQRDGNTINTDVLEWLKKVNEIQIEKIEILPSWKCIQCLPIPNPAARYRLGKEAEQDVQTVIELIKMGSDLLAGEIASFIPAVNVPTTEGTFYPSRNDAFTNLWQVLVNEDGPMIVGIYGMAGVGKTRTMKEIWKRAMETRIFNKVTQADVGNQSTLDVINLQTQIATHLGCSLVPGDDTSHRANQLKRSLRNGGKTLIILDDVRGTIHLEDIIGMGVGDDIISKGSKILFTSRKRKSSVYLDNWCVHPVEITVLPISEAREMFTNTVGLVEINSLNDKNLAEEMLHKCAGLPLVILAVAKALKPMTHNLWKDTLHKFQTNIESVPGIRGEVYESLKRSFDDLEEDARKCLLLCSLFPEDADIPMRRLIQFATGSQLVRGGRIRIAAMIDILKSLLLLLPGIDDEHFKLPGIIRDVAISVAVQDYAFSRAIGDSRLPDNPADYSRAKLLHLDVKNNGLHLPVDFACPDLHTLLVQGQSNISIPQFSGRMFVSLKFLVLIGFSSQKQFSLQSLLQLKTLFLDDCDLRNTNSSFYPKSLKTLCIWNCKLPTCLELPNLYYLLKLEIIDRCKLQMRPGITSRLPRLEELYIEYPSEIWDQSMMPRFREISELAYLKSLKIFWDSSEPFRHTAIFSRLVEFDIRVGERGPKKYRPASEVGKSIELAHGNNFEAFQGLVGKAEEVKLRNTNVDVGKIWNSNREAFEDLRILYIEDGNTMEHLAARISHEIQTNRFSILTNLEIRNCSKMRYLLSNSVAKCLVQLQHLSIFGCDLLEVIVVNDGTSDGGDIISFTKLKSLKLSWMKTLTSFCENRRDAHSSLTSDMDNSTIRSSESQPLFDGMVACPCLEKLELRGLEKTGNIWGNHYSSDNVPSFCQLKSLEVSSCHQLEIVIPPYMLDRLRNLKCLKVDRCNGLRNVLLPSIARGLVNLKKLEVMDCEKMTEIIGAGGQEVESTEAIIKFLKLTTLKLQKLPILSIFWLHHEVHFPNLVDIILHDVKLNLGIELGLYDNTCQLKYLDISCDSEIQPPSTWERCLYNLESLALRHCWSDKLKFMKFRKLKVLKVIESGCSTLFAFSVLGYLQHLEELEISNCGLLEEFAENARGDETSADTNNEVVRLFKMRSIVFKNLPNLKSFFGNYNFYMPALERVEVNNCELLTTLFTSAVSEHLQHLQYLHVYNCRSLEGIVKDATSTETCDNIIKLSGLLEFVIRDLPNLNIFGLTVGEVLVSVESEWQARTSVSDLNDFVREYRRKCDRAEDQRPEIPMAFLFSIVIYIYILLFIFIFAQ